LAEEINANQNRACFMQGSAHVQVEWEKKLTQNLYL
jgi:hypothetical protein